MLNRLRTDAEFDAWATVFADAFGMSAEGAENMRKAHRWLCSNLASRVYLLISRRWGAHRHWTVTPRQTSPGFMASQ